MSGNTAETRLDSLPSPPKDAPPQGEPVAHAIPDDAGPLDEDKLSRSELVELLRCERMRAQSLETLFSQYQTECEVVRATAAARACASRVRPSGTGIIM